MKKIPNIYLLINLSCVELSLELSQQIANRNWLWAPKEQTIVLSETSTLVDGTSIAFFVGYLFGAKPLCYAF